MFRNEINASPPVGQPAEVFRAGSGLAGDCAARYALVRSASSGGKCRRAIFRS
jgi:hypothetical protein